MGLFCSTFQNRKHILFNNYKRLYFRLYSYIQHAKINAPHFGVTFRGVKNSLFSPSVNKIKGIIVDFIQHCKPNHIFQRYCITFSKKVNTLFCCAKSALQVRNDNSEQ